MRAISSAKARADATLSLYFEALPPLPVASALGFLWNCWFCNGPADEGWGDAAEVDGRDADDAFRCSLLLLLLLLLLPAKSPSDVRSLSKRSAAEEEAADS